MSDALLIAIITGVFGLLGKVVDVLMTRAKQPQPGQKPKRKSRADVVNPLTMGGILNPATAILLVVGVIVGVAVANAVNQPGSTVTPTQPATEPPATVLAKGGEAQVHTTGGDRLRVREQPDFNSKVVAHLDNGIVVSLVDGPQKSGSNNWWLIKMDDGTTGWVVEEVDGVKTLQPVSP